MEDLSYLFDHGKQPSGFVWRVHESPKGFVLTRTTRSLKEEADMPDSVVKTARIWLGELRDYYRLSGKAREQAAAKAQSSLFQAPPPAMDDDDVTARILSTLSVDDFSRLSQGETITQSVPQCSPAIQDILNRNAFHGQGSLQDVSLIFVPRRNIPGTFTIGLQTTPREQKSILTTVIDPLGVLGDESNPNVLRLKDDADKETIELLAQPPIRQTNSNGDDAAGRLLNRRLQLIAEKANVNIYCEYLLPHGGPWQTLSQTGTVTQLLNETARAFHLNVVKHNGAYFLWSPTWFIDRPNLIPDKLLTRWTAIYESGKWFTLRDISEMAGLRDEQLGLLERMPHMLHLNGMNTPLLRFLARLPADQQQQAFSPEGYTFILTAPEQAQSLYLHSKDQSIPYPRTFRLSLTLDESRGTPAWNIIVNDEKDQIVNTFVWLRPYEPTSLVRKPLPGKSP